MSMPDFERKSAPRMMLYLQSLLNTNAFCWSMTRFLSSSGSLRFLMTTTSLVSQNPGSVLILHSCLMGQVLQCLDRHLWLTSVDVDPESNNTLSKVQDLTVDMVSTTIILVRVSRFLFGILIAGGTVPTLGGSSSLTRGYALRLKLLLTLTLFTISLLR